MNADDIPCPVLLNIWKHHAGALRNRIAACADDEDLARLAAQLVVIGTDLMDLYTGQLSAAAVARQVIAALESEGRLTLDAYRACLTETRGYLTVTLADQSVWILRLGEEAGRYVHIHPGRWSPQTRRVRANVLKTVVMVLAHVRVHGGEPMDVRLINTVRAERLRLSPIPAVGGDEGIGAVLALLQSK